MWKNNISYQNWSPTDIEEKRCYSRACERYRAWKMALVFAIQHKWTLSWGSTIGTPKIIVTILKITLKHNCKDFKEDDVVLYRTNERIGYTILQQAIFEKWVKAHHGGPTLGTLTCIKYIFLHNLLYLILGFSFNAWAWYFDFHKINDIWYYLKKN